MHVSAPWLAASRFVPQCLTELFGKRCKVPQWKSGQLKLPYKVRRKINKWIKYLPHSLYFVKIRSDAVYAVTMELNMKHPVPTHLKSGPRHSGATHS